MKKILSVVAVSAFCAFAAFASAENVSVSQDAETRMVAITYELTAPAIVTVDVELAGAGGSYESVGDAALSNAAGDVNRYVDKVGQTCTIKWQPMRMMEPCSADGIRATVQTWTLSAPPPYMVFDLDITNSVRFYRSEAGLPGGIANDIYRTSRLVMRRIPAAGITWRMGSPTSQYWRRSADGETAHLVTMARDYYIGVFEFTNYQYGRVCDSQSPSGKTPKGELSWNDLRGSDKDWPTTGHEVGASSFIQKLRTRTGQQMDLPTEAQWEYAARAGSSLALHYSNSDNTELDKIGWFWTNAHVGDNVYRNNVGLKRANAWGLYDTLGNNTEICLDWSGAYDAANQTTYDGEPAGMSSGTHRVMRSGYAWQGSDYITLSYRDKIAATGSNAFFGFRVVCPVAYVPPSAE